MGLPFELLKIVHYVPTQAEIEAYRQAEDDYAAFTSATEYLWDRDLERFARHMNRKAVTESPHATGSAVQIYYAQPAQEE